MSKLVRRFLGIGTLLLCCFASFVPAHAQQGKDSTQLRVKFDSVALLLDTCQHPITYTQAMWELYRLNNALQRPPDTLLSIAQKATTLGQGDAALQGRIYLNVANMYNLLGDAAAAERYTRQAISLLSNTLDPLLARAHMRLGNINQLKGAMATASLYYDSAYQHLDSLSSAPHILTMKYQLLNTIGTLQQSQGRLDSALRIYYQVLAAFAAQGDSANVWYTYHKISDLYSKRGQHAEAMQSLMMAKGWTEDFEFPGHEIERLIALGQVYQTILEHERAILYFNEALVQLNGQKGYLNFSALNSKALSLNALNQPDSALRYAHLALPEARSFPDQSIYLAIINTISKAWLQKAEADSALTWISMGLQKAEAIANAPALIKLNNTLGHYYHNQGAHAQALPVLQQAYAGADSLKLAHELETITDALHRVHAKLGNREQAYAVLLIHEQLTDSLRGTYNLARVKGLESSAALARQRERMQLQQEQAEAINEKEIRHLQLVGGLMALGLATLVVVVIIVLRLFRQKQHANETLTLQSAEISAKNEEILQQNHMLSRQNQLIEEKNRDIVDSILYAKRIQNAMLPSRHTMEEALGEVMVFFKPRDVVSGDFYWHERVNGLDVVAVVDCTGHGVPGAIMSMIGHDLLNEIVVRGQVVNPAEILSLLHEGVTRNLRQDETHLHDGMELAILVIDHEEGTLYYAGAKRPLLYFEEGQMHYIKGDRRGIGGLTEVERPVFITHRLALSGNKQVYLYSDGYRDQFGGREGKKYLPRRFRELLQTLKDLPTAKQEQALGQAFDQWRGKHDQTDDVLVLGLRL